MVQVASARSCGGNKKQKAVKARSIAVFLAIGSGTSHYRDVDVSST